MITVIIRDSGEPQVLKLTYENLWRELKDIANARLEVGSWGTSDNPYICWVEPDCLVNSGYFSSMVGLLKKPANRKISVLSSSVGINTWANRIYGYRLGETYADGVIPTREKKGTYLYPVQIAYIPGAVMRVNLLRPVLDELKPGNGWENDLVHLSTRLSLAFWNQKKRVYINPNTTYVTTEDYVNDIGKFDPKPGNAPDVFSREGIT